MDLNSFNVLVRKTQTDIDNVMMEKRNRVDRDFCSLETELSKSIHRLLPLVFIGVRRASSDVFLFTDKDYL